MLSWSNFWKGDPVLFRTVMQKSTEYAAEKLCEYNLVNKNTQLLDFGCGPGYLAVALEGRLKTYVGADISGDYINTARRKMEHTDYSQFHLISEKESGAFLPNELAGRKFNVIIILSVIQYFPSKTEVLSLLKKCRSLLSPDGKIIMADVISSEKNLWKDVWNVLLHSINKGYFFSFLRFLVYIKMSKYNALRKQHKLLQLTDIEVEEMSKNIGMTVAVLPRITLQASRISYSFIH